MHPQLKSQRGFTLIELLTVIGILAVLVAFSVAGVQKARLRACEVQDVSSLRQLGVAYNLMMNDLDEVRPNDFFDPLDKLWSYTSDSMNESAAWDERIAKAAAARKLLSSSYWKKVYAGNFGAGDQFPRSYSVNQWFFPAPPPESGQPNWERLSVRPMRIKAHPELVLMVMTFAPNTPGIAFRDQASPIYSGIKKTGRDGTQSGRTPVLFVDGRAVIADLSKEFNDEKSWGKEGE